MMLSYIRKREEKEKLKKIFWVTWVLIRESLKPTIGRQLGALIRTSGVQKRTVSKGDAFQAVASST